METVLISLRFQLSSDSEHFRGDPDLQLGLQQGPEPRLAGLDLQSDQHQVLGQLFPFLLHHQSAISTSMFLLMDGRRG